ncbi:hypothetical protein ACIBG0_40375 [Nocardia sp. NPDC050630]|uniref:hypothetical protein n=1 Tax=Nocardia sp. NPDC050630 TaxID=3364321 RepID=UPI0037B0921C
MTGQRLADADGGGRLSGDSELGFRAEPQCSGRNIELELQDSVAAQGCHPAADFGFGPLGRSPGPKSPPPSPISPVARHVPCPSGVTNHLADFY